MAAELIHVGFGHVLALNRVLAIAAPNTGPTKRLVQEGKARGMVLDLTSGRRTKAVLFMDDGHIALLAITAATLGARALAARSEAQPAGSGDGG